MLAALGFGLLIGTLLGLLGSGGSILAVPALIYGVGEPLHQAIPASLLVVGVSSLAGALPRIRARQIQWRMAAIFGVTGSVAAFAGTAVNGQLPARVVLFGFAAIMVIAGIALLRDDGTAGTACAVAGATIDWRRCLPRSLAAGITVGFLTGLFGVGGGFLIIPALVLLLGLDMSLAVGTSLVIIVLNSASGLLAHLGNTHLDLGVSIAFTATAVLGALAAARLAVRLPTDSLQRWFAYLVFAVAALVVTQTVLNPGAT